MLGLGFLCGGLRFSEQSFDTTTTKEMGILLFLATMSITIPTAYHRLGNDDGKKLAVPSVSRGTAIILMSTYMVFLLFQLRSHKWLFESVLVDGDSEASEKIAISHLTKQDGTSRCRGMRTTDNGF